ncbi:glycosyltransferase family 4 protein [Leptolyngbya sp. FACHB-261]|nr:glycosyltransferase family 4 protein [Leptolyngbya sp. FACHB-261]
MGWFPEQAGGLNRVYYDCMQYLPAAGVQMRGLVAGSPAVAQTSGGQVQAFAPREASLLQRWRGVRQAVGKALAEENYPLVVSHFALYTFPVLDRLGRRPLVMHFQGPWALEGRVEGGKTLSTWFKRQLEQTAYRRMTQFIVLSEAFRNILNREYGVPLERIHVVPPGVAVERFDPTLPRSVARTQLGWPQDRPILLAVRRLAKRMGLENLIAAMAQVRREHPDALLMIAGKGALGTTLQAQIEELNLTENVRLLGFVSDQDLALAYRAANFSVVPTVALEGFGLIVIESLAAGTPVLGTPVDSIPEILRPFSEDLVFESSAAEHLAQGISEALSGLRQLPSEQACIDYVQQHYTWPVIASRVKSVYQAALTGDAV